MAGAAKTLSPKRSRPKNQHMIMKLRYLEGWEALVPFPDYGGAKAEYGGAYPLFLLLPLLGGAGGRGGSSGTPQWSA